MALLDFLFGKKKEEPAKAPALPIAPATGQGSSVQAPQANVAAKMAQTYIKQPVASQMATKYLKPAAPAAPVAKPAPAPVTTFKTTLDDPGMRTAVEKLIKDDKKKQQIVDYFKPEPKKEGKPAKEPSTLQKLGLDALMGVGRGVMDMIGTRGTEADDAGGDLTLAHQLIKEGHPEQAQKILDALDESGKKAAITNPLTGNVSPVLQNDQTNPSTGGEALLRGLVGGAAEFVPAMAVAGPAGFEAASEKALAPLAAKAFSRLVKPETAARIAASVGKQAADTAVFTLTRSHSPEELAKNAQEDLINMFPSIVLGEAANSLVRAGSRALGNFVTKAFEDGVEATPKRVAEFLKGAADPELQKTWDTMDAPTRMSLLRAQTQSMMGENRMLGLKPKDKTSMMGESRPAGLTGPKTPLDEMKPKDPNVEPVERILESGRTPIWKRVIHLDYLRTPSRVLEKIGLKKEADFLRTQYDKYTKELPVEIQRVTDWAKRVDMAPDANARIFRWLDGEKDTPLNFEELKVATEIKDYLGEWADKLKLPKDGRVSDYITHIFDRDITPERKALQNLIKKETDPAIKRRYEEKLAELESGQEFPEDLARLIDNDKVASSVYNPFLTQRTGAIDYKQDTWQALDAYVKRATRKYNMDPALERTAKAAERLEDSQYKYVKRYIDRVNMRPTENDKLMDNMLKQIVGYKFGDRPTAAISKSVRQWIYLGTLGGNVSSAVKNLTQISNTYSQLGEKYTIVGYAQLAKNRFGGMQELIDNNILSGEYIQDRTLNATKKFWEKTDKGLFKLFEEAETINRGAAYFGAKAKALAGKVKGVAKGDEEAAIEYAKNLVTKTQFKFDAIDAPVALSSDFAKTIGQFQSYTTKQTEFLVDMLKGKEYAQLARYVGSSLAIYAVVGKALNMNPLDMIFPPNRLLESQFVPPAGQLPLSAIQTATGQKDEFGRLEGPKNMINSIVALIPGGVQAKKTLQGLQAIMEGGVDSASGKTRLFKTGDSPRDILQNLVFGKYSTKEAQAYFDSKKGKTALEMFTEFLGGIPEYARPEANDGLPPLPPMPALPDLPALPPLR